MKNNKKLYEKCFDTGLSENLQPTDIGEYLSMKHAELLIEEIVPKTINHKVWG